MKYIRFKSLHHSRDAFVVFDKRIPHRAMARDLALDDVGIRSAGFVRQTESGLECYGKSEGLNRHVLPDDTDLLNDKMDEPQLD